MNAANIVGAALLALAFGIIFVTISSDVGVREALLGMAFAVGMTALVVAGAFLVVS